MAESKNIKPIRRVAVVTGAGSGLGKACVEQFVLQKYQVVAVDVSFLESPERQPTNLLVDRFIGDVASEQDMLKLQEHISRKYGGVDYLVNCAGILKLGRTFDPVSLEPLSLMAFRQVLEVNVVGPFNVIRLLTPLMVTNDPDENGQRGVIINLSSILAKEGIASSVAFSASKAAVSGMTLPLAREFGPHGIRVVTIAAGFCDTPMLSMLEVIPAFATLLENTKVFPSRTIKPQEFAKFVQAIIDNPVINGDVLRFDGAVRVPSIEFDKPEKYVPLAKPA